MPTTIHMRLPHDVVRYFRAHPEVRPMGLLDMLLRKELNLDLQPARGTSNRLHVQLQDDTHEALLAHCKGKDMEPNRVIRALLTRFVERSTA